MTFKIILNQFKVLIHHAHYDHARKREGLLVRGRNRKKEMFYLTTHSTHFIYGYMALDIIVVKDHSDSERGNPLPPHGLFFPISSKGYFVYTIPQTE